MLLFLAGCGDSQLQGQASWAFPGLNWNGHIYRVTSEKVKREDIGEQLGSVTSFSEVEGAPETGTFSNTLPVGTKLYEIRGVDVSDAIAAEPKDKSFLKIIFDH